MNRVQDLPIEGVMTPVPTCVDVQCSVSGALAFLVRERYQSAPVIDRCGRIMGLVTRNALLSWLSEALVSAQALTLRELMLAGRLGLIVEPGLRIPADTLLQEAARRLVECEAPSALVTRDGEVVGILSLLDCVRALAYGDRPRSSRGRGHCFSPDGETEGSADAPGAQRRLEQEVPGQPRGYRD